MSPVYHNFLATCLEGMSEQSRLAPFPSSPLESVRIPSSLSASAGT